MAFGTKLAGQALPRRPTRPGKLKRIYGQALILALFATLTAELVSNLPWVQHFDNVYYDIWTHLAGRRNRPEHTAIVAIDDATLQQYQDTPLVFFGPLFARAIMTLRQVGVKVIGLDFIFSVSAESCLRRLDPGLTPKSRFYDQPLRQELLAGQVILAGVLTVDNQDKSRFRLPLPDLIAALPNHLMDVGLVNFFPDADGVLRRYTPALTDPPDSPRFTFAALLALKGVGLKPDNLNLVIADHHIPDGPELSRIGFIGPPQTFQPVPFFRLLAEGAVNDPDVQQLKDKVVIVAATHSGTQDLFPTPYSQGFLGWPVTMMSGAEVHANIVETLLTGRSPRIASLIVDSLYILVIVFMVAALFLRLPPLSGLGVGVMAGLTAAVLGYIWFQVNGVILPVAAVHLALVVGYLGSVLVNHTRGERKRTYLENAFGRYISPEVLDWLYRSGKEPDLGGEVREITAMFLDIRNFTPMAEALTPHELAETLNYWYGQVCRHILMEGGMIDKFMGDGLMAIFGAPAAFDDHARRAVKAALGIKKEIIDMRHWLIARFPGRAITSFDAGSGLHTGHALTGNIGSAQRMEFTAIGEAVNIASRLEGKTKELSYSVVASSSTVAAAGQDVITGHTTLVKLKGVTGELKVYEVLDLAERSAG
ncbi:MAG: adenylate/guanylate cyclase domain-containing protein [Deltaproteobacteria bacterium]|nr:adenylate/guanylate cyclase domain-containing protein [Deltaproteobacteria bacterium]